MKQNKYHHLAGLSKRASIKLRNGLSSNSGISKKSKLKRSRLFIENSNKKKQDDLPTQQLPSKPIKNKKSPSGASTIISCDNEGQVSAAPQIADGNDDTLKPLRHRKRQHRGKKRKADPDAAGKGASPPQKKKRGKKKQKSEPRPNNCDPKPGVSTTVNKVQKETTKPSLKSKLTEKLKGAKFRFINERLYSMSSQDAKSLFCTDASLFDVYHEGYRSQAAKWPVNPLDMIIAQIKRKPRDIVIADLGCGDAVLGASVHQKVHSFDLVAANERVTACDMAKLPLAEESVDMCVFCLALMGTNLADFILEAHRILKNGGTLKIAEIISRFFSTQNFRRSIQKMGFEFLKKKNVNNYFVLFDFKKTSEPTNRKPAGLALRPCLYKKR